MSTPDLPSRLDEVLGIDPAANAIEFEKSWWTYGDVAATARQVAALVPEPGTEVGILLRNRPISIGLLVGVLLAGGCVVTINPRRGREATRDDITALDLPLICGEPEDIAELVPETVRSTTVGGSSLGRPLVVDEGTHPRWVTRPGIAVRMLTSGTTGPPKRIDLPHEMLEQVLVGNKHYGSTHETSKALRRGVAVVNSPLVHLGGLFRVLSCMTDGRSFAFLERFTVDDWVDAVRRHRPITASLVPTALRMVLESDADPDDLSSLRSVISGTAPLDPDDADAFTRRFAVPVLGTYAATEFGGSVAGWNVADHKVFWSRKRGSVGRALAGCNLRVVAPETGEVVPPGSEGVLEVRASHIADGEWVRTTDIARIDPDGFLFILGRADRAINRGGFKVIPELVVAALERHPAVRAASVVARQDRRLGAVPVAAVELRDGELVAPEALLGSASETLARYELPAEIKVVDELPRTDSGKVDLGAVEALFEKG